MKKTKVILLRFCYSVSVATFSKACALTSRKYVSNPDISIPNLSDKLFFALLLLSFGKQPKNLIFQSCFTFNRPFVDYFQWKVRTYFQKICNWGRYSDAKLIKSIWNFLFTLLCFCFRKQPKNLNFQSFFTSNRPFGGYFQWNLCTYFQKICSWKRFNDAKSIADTSIFLVALLLFLF